ncbi:lysophospholipid acyltransferase [Agyrium rufum]|nr:lysophospholipid acyltransferase [Agyrium rufum]
MIPYINVPFQYGESLTGASVDELKFLTTMILSYPFAALLKRITDSKPHQKNLFIVAVSLFYLVGMFDLWTGVRTMLISSAGAYAIAKYVEGPFMPWIGFIFVMGHMSVNHIYRQMANAPSAIDITGAQMVMVMKLTAFCWNVYDGSLPDAELVEFQRERAIRELPSLLDYAGYIFFFPALFAGPSFDYAEYRKYIETTMFDMKPGSDPSKAPKTRKKRKIPRSGTPATFKAINGILWIGLFLKFNGWYNADLILSNNYKQYGFLRRVWFLEMLGLSTRMKYYGVWTLTEGACILSGLGYNGLDPKTSQPRWDRLQNVNPWGIEFAQNSRAYLENWNMNTNHWLRNYMYLRVTPKGKKPGFRASLATFVTSAFWHGFYPGYYLTFVLAAFMQTVAKNFRRYIRPFFMTPDGQSPNQYKPYYDIASYFVTQTAFCFTTAPFVLLTLPASIAAWAHVYFYTVVGVAASIAFFASPAKSFLIQKLQERNQTPLQRVRTNSQDAKNHPVLGLPNDPGREVGEAVQEVRDEVEARRRRGASISMPKGKELQNIVEAKIGKKL